MKYKLLTIISALFLAIEIHGQVPEPENSYPMDAHLVPVSNAANLQSELNTHKKIRLEPAKYNASITISSDCEIYGLPGTQLGYVTVEGGTTNAILSKIICIQLIFPASTDITKNNLFNRIQSLGGVQGENCRLENNVFFESDGLVNFVTNSGGWMRNNHFIRVKAHGVWPSITMKGDVSMSSYGNVFLWYNFLTPAGDATVIENQKTLKFIGLDVEGTNYKAEGTGRAFLDYKGGEQLVLFGGGGSQSSAERKWIQVLDVDVEKIITCGFGISKKDVYPLVQLGKSCETYTNIESSDYTDYGIVHENTLFNNADIFTSTEDSILLNSKPSDDFTETDKNVLDEALTMITGKPWEIYNHDESIPTRRIDSAGWETLDHTEYLQGLIDTNGIAFLDSGIYYTSSPLLVGENEGLIGMGKGKTIIRALVDTFSIIENKQAAKTVTNPGLILSDLSLESGENGIRFHSDSLFDFHLLSTQWHLSHVEIYNMKHAGLFFDYQNGYTACADNSTIDYVDFIECTYGVRQLTGSTVNAYQPPYVDKVTFYRCKFIKDSIGVSLAARRADNLNAWIDCLFKDNLEKDIYLSNNNKPIAALCKFESPHVNRVIEARGSINVVNCIINSGKSGAHLFPYDANIEGCTITVNNGEIADVSLKEEEAKFILLNSTVSGNISTSYLFDALLYNNSFDSNPEINYKLVSFKDAVSSVIIDKEPSPSPRLLIDEYDCNGVISGSATIDSCGVCVGGNTGVISTGCQTGVNSDIYAIDIMLYPNPTDGNLYLSEGCLWSVVSLQGKELLSGTEQEIILSNFPDGMYILQIEDNGGMLTSKKFILEK